MTTTAAPMLQTLVERFPQFLLKTSAYRGQDTAVIKREGLLEMAGRLRDDPGLQCDLLMDLTAVDYLKYGRSLGSAPTRSTPSPLPYYMKPKPTTEIWERAVSNETYRFDVVYHLFSSVYHHRIRLHVPVTAADPVVDSLTSLWAGANWFEREVWDLFGIRFTGHPNLRRILMYDEFQGHPLRKDYPVNKRQPLIGPTT